MFQSTVGTPKSRWGLQKEFKKYMSEAGLAVIRFRDLRHTAASLMLNHGIDAFIVSRRLGLWPYALSIYTFANPTYNQHFKAKQSNKSCSAG